MSWVYDAVAHKYRDGNRVLSEKEMLSLRNAIADGMSTESAGLAEQLVSGEIGLAEWAPRFAQLIRDGNTSAYVLGRGGVNQMDTAAHQTLDGLIANQNGYAKSWTPELAAKLNDGSATVDGVAARSALYSGSAVMAFDVGRSDDFMVSLPYYPADGNTECGGNCRCEWSIEDTDIEMIATWITEGDDHVCDDCMARGNEYGPGSPFVQSKVAA